MDLMQGNSGVVKAWEMQSSRGMDFEYCGSNRAGDKIMVKNIGEYKAYGGLVIRRAIGKMMLRVTATEAGHTAGTSTTPAWRLQIMDTGIVIKRKLLNRCKNECGRARSFYN